jgi:hypothetical protein
MRVLWGVVGRGPGRGVRLRRPIRSAVIRSAVVTLALLVSSTAEADLDAGRRPTLAEWVAVGDQIMSITSRLNLPTVQDLNPEHDTVKTLRDGLADLKAHESTFSPTDLKLARAYETRVTAWTTKEDVLLTAETTARTDVVLPLCEAVSGLAGEREALARERANPAGVVNLATLHQIGEFTQVYEAQIKALTPAYVALRHHAFGGWQSEGACVAGQQATAP